MVGHPATRVHTSVSGAYDQAALDGDEGDVVPSSSPSIRPCGSCAAWPPALRRSSSPGT